MDEYGKWFVLTCLITGCVLTIADKSRVIAAAVCSVIILLLLLKIFIRMYADYYSAKRDALLCRGFAKMQSPAGNTEIQQKNEDFAILQGFDKTAKRIPDALEIAEYLDRVILAGATRSGKTFCSKQIAYLKLQQGHTVIAFDPKPIRKDDTWPDGVRIFGTNDDYDGVFDGLDWLENEKLRRAKDFDNIAKYPKIIIFWDELANMLLDVPEFQPHYMKILTKYAEYRIDLFAITQSDDYESCGLPKAQYKRNYQAVLFFEHDMFTGERRVFYNDKLKMPTTPETSQLLKPYEPKRFSGSQSRGHGKKETGFGCGKPNDFKARDRDKYDRDRKMLPSVTTMTDEKVYVPTGRIFESREEKDIVEMYLKNPNISRNDIAREVWGYSKGTLTQKIGSVLREHGF